MKLLDSEMIQKIKKYNVILIISIAFSFAISIVFPFFLLVGIALIVLMVYVDKQEKSKVELDKESELTKQGYQKISKSLWVNESEKKLNIFNKIYGFAQIIDCELIENDTAVSSTKGKTNAKNIKKIKSKTTTIQSDFCKEMYVNITTDSFEEPIIRLNFILPSNKPTHKGTNSYKESLSKAQKVMSALKIIISKNNEKFIENGTVTKIEHRHVTEETVEEQIKKLGELHRAGVLTDYEFSTKKMELLEKLK